MEKHWKLNSDITLPYAVRIVGIISMLLHAAVWYFWMSGSIPDDFGGETFALAVILPFALAVAFLIWAFIAVIIYILIYMGVTLIVYDPAKKTRILENVKKYVLRFYGTFPSFNMPITLNTFIATYFVMIAITILLTISDFLGVTG